MKAITIHQPHAQLIANGAKTYETRGWRTHYRGLVAIHASTRFDTLHRELCLQEPFASALDGHADLPTGAIIAIATLTGCSGVEYVTPLPNSERAFGDWRPGRYAWRLENVLPLHEPLRIAGRQGLWTLPDSVLPFNVVQPRELALA